jgi:hypothetical protein
MAKPEAKRKTRKASAKRASAGMASQAKSLSPAKLAELYDYRRGPQGRIILVRRGVPHELNRLQPGDIVQASGLYDSKRKAKRARYLKLSNDPKYKGPLLLAEGDSWFEHPCPKDIIELVGRRYAVLSLAKAGDTWTNYAAQEGQRYNDGSPMGLYANLKKEKSKIVLLSGSGNEIMGDIENYVRPFDPARPADQYIIMEKFQKVLDYCGAMLITNIRSIVDQGAHVVFHGYDYPDPRSANEGGTLIGGPLELYCKIPGPTLWRAIVNQMLDLYHDHVFNLLNHANEPKAHFIDLRQIIGNPDPYHGPNRSYWWDEIHPSTDGCRLVAAKFLDKIKEIAKTL